VGALTFGMLVGALPFGRLVYTLTFGMLVGTFTPPALALARSAPTTTAQRVTERLTSFVALILCLLGLEVKCYQRYVLLMLRPVVPCPNSLSRADAFPYMK
jgi:hypothetical protein